MADVDLLVQVQSAGVPDAIANLNRLKAAGLQTSSAMTGLATSTAAAMRNISNSTSGATGKITQYNKAISETGKGALSLKQQLSELEKGYARISKLSPNATEAQRLTIFGNGDLERGKQMVSLAEQLRRALNPDMSRDRLAVEREQLRVMEQQAQKARDIAATNNGQRGLQRARYDYAAEQRGITEVQRAQTGLTRATQDLTRAQAALRATTGSGDASARVAAMRAEEQAIRRVIAAQNELKRAQTQETDHGNAFQSSFSYFILAGLAQQVTQSILAVGTAAVTASAQIERSFADVERTFEGTDAQLSGLQGRLKELATQTPVSVVDLAEIATLGNQLGVAAADIESFTTTIAQYTAVSGQSAEDAATAFGRISNLTGLAASEYSNLASAITYVARTTVATESTIQNTAKEITALASGAGFSAQSIVGLAGALSSLAIPPERARGALSLYFGALNGAVAEGGPKLAAFAQLTGKTTDEIGRLVRENRGEEVFTSFIAGLSKLDTVAKTTALDTLGLSTIRVDQTMRALAQNVPLVTSSLAGANQAFEENSEIASQYAIIQETLASKFIEFQNSVQLAAGAVGDALAPALKELLSLATDIIVNFTAFAETPFGQGLIVFAGIVTATVLVMATLIGALALVKASLTVIPWALTGLSASTANRGIVQFIAGLLGFNLAADGAAVKATTLSGALLTTGASSRAAAAGFTAMRLALITTGIGAVVVLIGTLVAALDQMSSSSALSADSVTGLNEAIKADTETYKETGKAIATFRTEAAQTADNQDKAANASQHWATVLGTDLVKGAQDAKEAIDEIAAGDQVTEVFRKAIGESDVFKGLAEDSNFAKQWKSYGLNMTELIAEGLRDGANAGTIRKYLEDQLGPLEVKTLNPGTSYASNNYYDEAGNNVTKFREQLLSLAPVIASESTLMQENANTASVLASGMDMVTNANGELVAGFIGAEDVLTKYQNALGSGVAKFVSFSDVLGKTKDRLGIEDGVTLVNAKAFSADLAAASSSATDFFNGVQQLAANGSTQFALELASMGPEAQGILAGALALDGPAAAELEANARFAAFLASDAFKTAFGQSMETNNSAYALIFSETGDLGQVQSYIAAQVAGIGAEWELQWLLNHPDLPLNVTPDLQDPTPEDIAVFEATMSGRLTVTATVTPVAPSTGSLADLFRVPATGTNTYSDSTTGASITLPATLSQGALNDSLVAWMNNQNATPEEIAAMLNTDGFSGDVAAWRAANGPVTVYANLVPTLSSVNGLNKLIGESTRPKAQLGGMPLPAFRDGGGYGMFRGAGTGTSDSILARVSAGEYINTNDSRRFWGTDFFESLNRKMLPTNFVNMLGVAAASGSRGPTHVAHVSLVQHNPLTRDPLVQLRQDSEQMVAGIWGGQ